MRAAGIYKFLWLVFSVLSIMVVVGCSRGDDYMICRDINCSALHRSCTEAVGTEDAYCGDCRTGYSDKDGTCTEPTTCAQAEYELHAPTATSDHECAALTACDGSDQIIHGDDVPTDGSATRDRTCCHLHTGDITVNAAGGWPVFDEECLYLKGSVTIHSAGVTDDRLVAVEGNVVVTEQPINLQVFKNLESIGEDLTLVDQIFVNFQGLEKLQSVGGYLSVYDNVMLESFRGLESLQTIQKGLRIVNNDNFVSFEGLEQLTEIGELGLDDEGVYIGNNQNLVNFQGLENLETITGDFAVGGKIEFDEETFHFDDAGNANLENFKGLESLRVVQGDFDVFGNDALVNFEGLESLERIEGDFFVGEMDGIYEDFLNLGWRSGGRGNERLVSFKGLESVRSIGGDLVVGTNRRIENFQGFDRLVNVGGKIAVTEEDDLRNFEGIESLQSVGGRLFVVLNESLESFQGLENVETIGEGFGVSFNNSLVDLSGLGSVTTAGDEFVFGYNEILCADLVDELAAQVGNTQYFNNDNDGECH